MIISADEELTVIRSTLEGAGVTADDARLQAELLVEGDLRGHPSHGLQRLPVIVGRVRNGLALSPAPMRRTWHTASALVVDGGRGLGPVVAWRVLDDMLERTPATGVTTAAIYNNNHLGMLAPYVEYAAERGFVAMATTTAEPLVHPWNGRRAMLGTNPIAIAVPASPAPLVLDMATGVVSMGKIHEYMHRGAPLEPGWALDGDGVPTTDASRAAGGAIAPFGGPKGYALGLALEAMVGSLTGSALGTAVGGTLDTDVAANKGDIFLCIDPGRFGAASDAAARVTAFLQEVRECDPIEPDVRVLVPGDRARELRKERLSNGIPIADSVWEETLRLRAEFVTPREAAG